MLLHNCLGNKHTTSYKNKNQLIAIMASLTPCKQKIISNTLKSIKFYCKNFHISSYCVDLNSNRTTAQINEITMAINKHNTVKKITLLTPAFKEQLLQAKPEIGLNRNVYKLYATNLQKRLCNNEKPL